MKKKLILLGGGGHCISCIDVIEQSSEFVIHGILDKPEYLNREILGYKVVGDDSDINKFIKMGYFFLITVGQIRTPDIRIKLFDLLCNSKANLATIVSPRAYVSRHSRINRGTIIMHDVLINAGVSIGQNCIINTKALIEHGSIIEDHCHISTASVINGDNIIRKGTFFGSNSTSKECSTIEKMSFIKAHNLFVNSK